MALPELAIGIDLGGTKIAAVLMASDGSICAEDQVASAAADGPDEIAVRIARLIERLHGAARGPIAGVGIGSPGRVDATCGMVYDAVNLGWDEVALARYVTENLPLSLAAQLPVFVQQDANIEALGESYFGVARGCTNFVYLGLGTGLGGGLFVNGDVVGGATLMAGELGHLVLDPTGYPCACGSRGCAETVVSGSGILNVVRDLLSRPEPLPTHIDPVRPLTTGAIIEAASAGDPLALAAMERCGSWLGAICASCIAVVNPAKVVIGGGFGRAAFDLLLPTVWRELRCRVLAAGYSALEIVPSQIASSAVGAACLVWQTRRARHVEA